MKFETTLAENAIQQYHTDPEVRVVDGETEPGNLIISSWLMHAKNDLTEMFLQNDDGFLFFGDAPEYKYAYEICLAFDTDLFSERCMKPFAVTSFVPEPYPVSDSCTGVTDETLANLLLLDVD